jgi:hypothetical protein
VFLVYLDMMNIIDPRNSPGACKMHASDRLLWQAGSRVDTNSSLSRVKVWVGKCQEFKKA